MAKFVEVIVEEVISDVSFYTQEKMSEIVPLISNKRAFCDEPPEQTDGSPDSKYYLRAPRNSILGRKKEDGKNVLKEEKGSLTVFYPFFSSHFVLPVKPGEIVWVFENDPVGYWMTRVHTPAHVEDANFTHYDRSNAQTVRQPPIEGPDGVITDTSPEGKIERVPNFPDGNSYDTRNNDKRGQTDDDILASNPDKRTFQRAVDVEGNTHYEEIYLNNNEAKSVVYEPVPALTRRPGDLVLQGSNNTSIVLGLDRGYPSDVGTRPTGDTTNATPTDDLPIKERAGSIDIVAGRGRLLETEPDSDIELLDPKPGRTHPRIIKNIREKFETDKNLGLDEGKAGDGANLKDVSEGDPDFLYDASRVYVSMKTDPDKMTGLVGNLPKTVDVADPLNAGIDPTEVTESAAVIVKSDEIRIIARQEKGTSAPTSPDINGSIKIVKEGVPDSRAKDGRAVVMIQPDGTIVIDGPKIVVGSGAHADTDGHGGGQQVSLGLGATEPLVLGKTLGDLLCKFIGAIVQNQASISVGVSPNMLNPAVLLAAQQVLTALGGTAPSTHDPTKNTTLSKLGKTK